MNKVMKKKSIGINLVHTFKKLLDSTSFGTETTFMLELLQNTQRAGARKVEIELYENYLRVKDDGEGCDKPEKVFNISESGFGIGFGEGFTSLYGLHGKITVRTQHWKAFLDVEKIYKSTKITEEDLKFNLLDEDIEYFPGFEVIVESEKLSSMRWKLEEEIKENCSLIKGIDFYFNGQYIEKRKLLDVKNKHGLQSFFENRFCKGVIAPLASDEYSNDYGIKVYYESRYVNTIYRGFSNFYGVVELKPNKVDLKSPDRTDIIKNTKYDKFHKSLKKEAYNVALDVLKTENWDLIESYESVIQNEIKIETIIRFLTIDKKDAFYKKEEEETEQEFEQEQELELTEEEITEVIINHLDEKKEKERTRQDNQFISVIKANKNNYTISKKDLNRVKITELKKYKNLIWCTQSDLNYYQEIVDQYEYYGVVCFVAKNEIYAEALRYLGVKRVSELDEDNLKKEYSIKNANPKSAKEKRALEVLSMIEEFLNVGRVFYISDINCTLSVELYEGKKVHKEKMIVNGYSSYPEINLNRKSLLFPKNMNQNLGKEQLTKSDITFLLCNIELITHELAHHIYGTNDNTKEHYEAIFELQNKIAKKIYNI